MEQIIYYTDEDETYEPTWLTQPRGFIDVPARQAKKLESVMKNLQPNTLQDWSHNGDAWTLHFDGVTLQISGLCRQGVVEASASGTAPRKKLDSIRAELRKLVSSVNQVDRPLSAFDFEVFLLQAIEAVDMFVGTRKPATANANADAARAAISTGGWQASGTSGYESMLTNDSGLDLSTVSDMTMEILQKPIVDICADLPDCLRVLHVEPVYRNDLISRFLSTRKMIEEQLLLLGFSTLRAAVPPTEIPWSSSESTKEGLAAHLASPSVTFHGAPRSVIGSIVRNGFLLPGTGNVNVRCGETYGRGIYSSPDPVYASSYTYYSKANAGHFADPASVPGLRLVICATLLGRPVTVTRKEAWGVTEVVGGEWGQAHSHVSRDGMERVVFDAAQIIPVYVLHLDYGAEEARKAFAEMPTDPREFLREKARVEKKAKETVDAVEASMPGYIKAQKEARKAAALKLFPYGFGSARGTNFKIQEIAEIDDDEEVWGDLQFDRVVQDDPERQRRIAAGGSWFDEYQLVRKSK